MWKIVTTQIREEIYNSLVFHGLLPEDQKKCRKKTRGTDDLLYIEEQMLKKVKTMQKKLSHDMDGFKKGLWYSLTNLDNRISENVPNI